MSCGEAIEHEDGPPAAQKSAILDSVRGVGKCPSQSQSLFPANFMSLFMFFGFRVDSTMNSPIGTTKLASKGSYRFGTSMGFAGAGANVASDLR